MDFPGSQQDRGFTDFLKAAGGGGTTSASQHHNQSDHSSSNATPSASGVASSAKVLLDAAVAKLHKTESQTAGNGASKAEIAAAASEVLAAARHYGKLDDKNYGKYVLKAEDYLRKHGTSSSSHSAATNPSHFASRPPPASENEQDEDNKYFKYLKKAEEFINKH